MAHPSKDAPFFYLCPNGRIRVGINPGAKIFVEESGEAFGAAKEQACPQVLESLEN